MNFTEKISLEEINGKRFRNRTIEPENNKDAVLTHYMHNHLNGVSKFYKTDAIEYTKEILQYKYPEENITTAVAEEALQYGLFSKQTVTQNPA